MPFSFPRAGFVAAAGGGGGYALPYTTDLAAAYAADQITGLSDGDAVTTWQDLSGNGRHLTGTNSPTFESDGSSLKNGLPVVRTVAASSQYFASASFGQTKAMTLFVVWKSNASDQSNYARIIECGANNGLAIVNSTGDTLATQWCSGTLREYSPGVSIGTDWHLIEYVSDGGVSTNNLTWLHNGGNQTGPTVVNATPTTPTALNLARYGGGGFYTSGDYAEVVYYAADIGSSNRATVRDYLNTKWAIY